MRSAIFVTGFILSAAAGVAAQAVPVARDTVYIASVDADSVTLVIEVVEGVTQATISFREVPGDRGRPACPPGIPPGTPTPAIKRCPRYFDDQPVHVRVMDQRPLGKITIPGRAAEAEPGLAVGGGLPRISGGRPSLSTPRPAGELRQPGDPELPRAEPVLPTGYSKQIRVATGRDLQRAIDRAVAGDEILLEAGTRYMGPFELPREGDDGWVRIATEVDAPSGVRVDTTLALAILTARAGNWTVRAGEGASGWDLSLLDITHDGERLNSPVHWNASSGEMPSRILLDRVWIHPRRGGQATRAVIGNASDLTIRYSALTGIVRRGQQTQGISQWSSGVTLIHDNLIMAASQGYMCGGAGGVRSHPSDITIRRNHIVTPREWQGRFANLAPIETKDCHRLLVEGNVIDGGTLGFLLKSSAQGGICGEGCGSEHLTIRNNIIRNTRGGANLARITSAGGVPMHDVLFDNNLFEQIGPSSRGWSGGEGRLFQVLSAPENLTLRNTTFDTRGHSWLFLANGPPTPSEGLTVDNVVATGPLRYPVLIRAPRGFDRHYRTHRMGTAYGACAGAPGGLSCISSVSHGAGADRDVIAAATRGVVR